MAVEPQTLRGEHRPLRRVAEAFNEDAFLFVPVSFVRRLIEHRTLLVRVGRTWRYGTEGLKQTSSTLVDSPSHSTDCHARLRTTIRLESSRNPDDGRVGDGAG